MLTLILMRPLIKDDGKSNSEWDRLLEGTNSREAEGGQAEAALIDDGLTSILLFGMPVLLPAEWPFMGSIEGLAKTSPKSRLGSIGFWT